MTIKELLAQGRKIWADTLPLGQFDIVVAMGVVYGDICRNVRDEGTPEEMQKEMGNIILSTIRWCDDQGFDPEECIRKAIQCQREFVAKRVT